ncbi:hypothetical protein MXB_361 [Myxobolus squamalis]|nr:hypothetical protein MXB_361 [Myxobolus squamalis]
MIYYKSDNRELIWYYPKIFCLPVQFQVFCMNNQYEVKNFTKFLNTNNIKLDDDIKFCNVTVSSWCETKLFNKNFKNTTYAHTLILQKLFIISGTILTIYLLYFIEKTYFNSRVSRKFIHYFGRNILKLNCIYSYPYKNRKNSVIVVEQELLLDTDEEDNNQKYFKKIYTD